MELMRTEVTTATTAYGRPILRVTFCGESADCVTVETALC
jgi:hypothetical protein